MTWCLDGRIMILKIEREREMCDDVVMQIYYRKLCDRSVYERERK